MKMLTLKDYMAKVGVVQKRTVLKWIKKGLIPRVKFDGSISNAQFLDSSRRPYQSSGVKPNMDQIKIKTHMVRAAINRAYFDEKTFYTSKGEYQAIIRQLIKANLIQKRTEDGVIYYDSTMLSEEKRNASMKELRSFVCDIVAAVSKGSAEGVTTAYLNHFA